MPWYIYVIWFFIGALLANSIPHIAQGMCGNRFQTPFARPRGVGESSAVVNVVWGFSNLAIAGVLLHVFAPPQLPPQFLLPWPLCIAAGLGALVLALYLARRFGAVRNQAPRP